MLMYRDFVPSQLKQAGLEDAQYESFEKAVHAAREFIKNEGVELVQLETVVLPNIHRVVEEGSTDPALVTDGTGASWHQFLRVWFQG